MGAERLVIHGAREHNLKNVTLDLPRDELIVFTGLSGSGKCSLAFDTIYAEGQRRYVESLSSYARQFLGRWRSPTSTSSRASRPAISIDQKSTSRNPRSTVGHHHRGLRLPAGPLRPGGPPALPQVRAADRPPDPRPDRRPGHGAARGHAVPGAGADRPGPQGGVRASCSPTWRGRASPGPAIDGEVRDLSEPIRLPKTYKHTSRSWSTAWSPSPTSAGGWRTRSRPRSSSPKASPPIAVQTDDGSEELQTFSQKLACTYDGISFDELAPRNFSFNSPYGACPTCDGLGTRLEVDPELVVPDPDLSIDEGAIAPWAAATLEYWNRVLEAVAEAHGVSTRHAVEAAAQGGARDPPVRLRREDPRPLQEPVRPAALLPHHLRGRDPQPRASPRRDRIRHRSATSSSSSCARSRAEPARAPG